jgi:hypothetical protein
VIPDVPGRLNGGGAVPCRGGGKVDDFARSGSTGSGV